MPAPGTLKNEGFRGMDCCFVVACSVFVGRFDRRLYHWLTFYDGIVKMRRSFLGWRLPYGFNLIGNCEEKRIDTFHFCPVPVSKHCSNKSPHKEDRSNTIPNHSSHCFLLLLLLLSKGSLLRNKPLDLHQISQFQTEHNLITSLRLRNGGKNALQVVSWFEPRQVWMRTRSLVRCTRLVASGSRIVVC
jgi:hypothetical protein